MWNGYGYNNLWIGAGNIPPVVPYGGGSYGPPSYGVPPVDRGPPPRDFQAMRYVAQDEVIKVYKGTGHPNVGYRRTPWGGETVIFDAYAGMERWWRIQVADLDVWYAATFNLLVSTSPLSEFAR